MDGRNELFAYLGTSLVTIAVLFGLQHWYVTYLDVFVVHADGAGVPLNPKVAAVRQQEGAKLKSLTSAKQTLASRGRSAVSLIAPKPSEDLTPMSGWIHRPGFAAYESKVPQAVATAPLGALVEAPAEAPVVEGAPHEQP